MARVFVSFVTEDQSVAQAGQGLVENELALKGQVFLSADETQVLAGHDWLTKIREALKNCEVQLLMLSGRSLRRPWINFEGGAAWILDRPVIPVCFGHASKSELPHPYSNMKAVQLPDDVHHLLTSLHQHLKLPGNPPGLRVLERIDDALREQEQPKRGFAAFTSLMDDPYKWLDFNLSAWKDEPQA